MANTLDAGGTDISGMRSWSLDILRFILSAPSLSSAAEASSAN
jgi:hypothetical protein